MVFECSCTCCLAFKPRYKRLVNNIYPANLTDSSDKSNVEKLKFYAHSHPEKLDRIGHYLAQQIARDLYRHRINYVSVGVDAIDKLLANCDNQSLNLFVESFLKVVQSLLESQDTNIQLLGSQSFVKFAQVEEDTPSYHRRYDFFVSKFASMSHSVDKDYHRRMQIRMAGLNGLKSVIRKTVSDDLQANIWDETHMDKIVPSLLYNMQSNNYEIDAPTIEPIRLFGSKPDQNIVAETPLMGAGFGERISPESIAEECLKELMRRATFGHIKCIIKPVLKHIDSHDLWRLEKSDNFSIHLFQEIMYSIQPQHSYAVIQILMNHLDDRIRADAASKDQEVKIGIVVVLSKIVAIGAAESIGPSVLEIINSLLEHLRTSINAHGKREILFQEAIMDTLKEFSINLPDYQKTEIFIFIQSRAPTLKPDSVIGMKLKQILQDLKGSGPEILVKNRHELSLSRNDINSISVDVESTASSPDAGKKQQDEFINYETFAKALSGSVSSDSLEHRKSLIVDWFKTATFDELIEKARTKKNDSSIFNFGDTNRSMPISVPALV